MKIKKKALFIVPVLVFLFSCSCKSEIVENKDGSDEMPRAKKVPKEMTLHGDTRIDNYFWMRLSDEQKTADNPDSQTTDVLKYLEEENQYLQNTMSHTKEFQDELYDELVGRIKKDDQSVPVKDNGYFYYTRFEKDADYPLYCRKKIGEEKEEIIFDGPEMAKGHTYYGIGGRTVSENNKLMTFAIDTVSRRRYTIYFKNLETGEVLSDQLSNTTGRATWANDNKTVFYTSKDPETLRGNKVYKHVLGTDQSLDELVFEETDETYNIGVYKTKSNAFIVIFSRQTLSTEFRVLDADNTNGEWKVVQPREKNLEYSISHYKDHFYIRTNLDAKNFRLVKTPVDNTTKDNWVDVIPHREDVFFQSFDLFSNHLVVQERENGLRGIRIINWNGDSHKLNFNDPSYLAYTSSNLDFDTNILRYNYTSLTTPNSTYEYNMDTREQVLLKQTEIIDDKFSSDNYTSERLYAKARDGVDIPISLVYNKNTKINNINFVL